MNRAQPPLRPPQIAIAAALACLTACASSYQVPEEPFVTRTLPVRWDPEPPRAFDVHLRRGQVLLQHGAALTGDVIVQVCAEAASAAAARADAVRLVMEGSAQHRELRVTHPPDCPLDAVDTRYVLHVPADVGVRVFTQMARVAVRGFRGHVEVVTDSGAIDARLAGGRCDLATQSGAIRLEGDYTSARVRSVNGPIAVTLPHREDSAPPVELRLSSDSGRVRVDLNEGCQMALQFATLSGEVVTELPLRWALSNRQDGENLFRGLVGHEGRPQRILADIRTDSSNVEVRRLPASATPAR